MLRCRFLTYGSRSSTAVCILQHFECRVDGMVKWQPLKLCGVTYPNLCMYVIKMVCLGEGNGLI